MFCFFSDLNQKPTLWRRILRHLPFPAQKCPVFVFVWAWERTVRGASCSGASGNEERMLLSEMQLAQMDRQIKGNWWTITFWKSPVTWYFCVVGLKLIAPPPTSPLQSAQIRPNSVTSCVERRWPILDSAMSDRLVQHLEQTCGTFRQTVRRSLGRWVSTVIVCLGRKSRKKIIRLIWSD